MQIIDFIFTGVIFVLISSALIIFFKPSGLRINNVLLALAFVIISLSYFYLVLRSIGMLSRNPHLLRLVAPLVYAVGPLLFFYVRNTFRSKSGLEFNDFLHFIPVVIHFIDLVPFYFSPVEVKRSMALLIEADINQIFISADGFIPIWIHYSLKTVSLLIYVGFCLSEYGYYKDKINLGVLRETRLIILGFLFFALMQAVTLLNGYFGFYASLESLDITFLIQLIFLFLSIIFFMVFILGHITQKYAHEVTSSELIGPTLEEFVSTEDIKLLSQFQEYYLKKYSISNLKKIGLQIENTLKSDEKFRDPEYSVEHLADSLEIHPKDLSYIINAHFKIRFTELVNKYRVSYAKSFMESDDAKHLTIEGMASLSGFRSKSTFYRAFKKYEGCTPSEYLLRKS
jgi:AraC-like DNA-binding protein